MISLLVTQDLERFTQRDALRFFTKLLAHAREEQGMLILNGDLAAGDPRRLKHTYPAFLDKLNKILARRLPRDWQVLVNSGNWDAYPLLKRFTRAVREHHSAFLVGEHCVHTVHGIPFILIPSGEEAFPAAPCWQTGTTSLLEQDAFDHFFPKLFERYGVKRKRSRRATCYAQHGVARLIQYTGAYEGSVLHVTPRAVENALRTAPRDAVLVTHGTPRTRSVIDRARYYHLEKEGWVRVAPLTTPKEALEKHVREGWRMEEREEHIGSAWLRRLICTLQPRLVLTGHVHEASGREAWVQCGEKRVRILNAGSAEAWLKDGVGGTRILIGNRIHIHRITP